MPWGHMIIGPDRFSRLNVYWIKINSDKFLLLRCVGNVGVNLELQADKQRSILQTEESIKQLQSEKWQLELEVEFKFIRDRISLF